MATQAPDSPQLRERVDANPGRSSAPPPAFLTGRSDAPYWLLVDQLMHLGWYRLGRRAEPEREWGFRYGFTLSDHAEEAALSVPQERWMRAMYERTAMRRLLRELESL